MNKTSVDVQSVAQRGWNLVRKSPLIAVGSINGVMLVISIAISLLTVRVLSKEDYGHLVYYYAGFAMLRLLMNFGLGINLSRDVAISLQQPEQLRVIIYSSVVLRMIITAVVVLILVIVNRISKQPYLEYIAATAIVASFADLVFSFITGLRSTRWISIMTAVQPVTDALFVFVLILIDQATSTNFMLIDVVAFGLMFIVGVTIITWSKRFPRPDLRSIKLPYVISTIAFAVPIYLSTLGSQGWSSFVSGILGVQQQFRASAEFGIVFNLIGLMVSISSPTLVTTFFPQMSYLHGKGDKTEIIRYITSTLTMLVYAFLFIGVALFSFPETVISLMFGETYRTSAPYLTLLSPVVLTIGITPIFTLTLVALGYPWRALIGMAVQLLLVLGIVLLIPYGASPMSLSIAALSSSVVALVVQAYTLKRVLGVWILPKHGLQILTIIIIAGMLMRVSGDWIGIRLSIWHFVVGAVFAAIYWLRVITFGGTAWLTNKT